MNKGSTHDTNSSVKSEIHSTLPLDVDQIPNYQDILSSFQLSEVAKNKLIHDYPTEISEVYRKVRDYGVPLLVTCDSLLQTVHAAFDNIMKIMEEQTLFDKVLESQSSSLLSYQNPEKGCKMINSRFP